MNLQSKKVRLPIAALGVTALCSGGIGIFASPAFAATEIGLNTGATTIGVANFGTTTTATANAAYALKIQDSTAVTNSAIATVSAPTGGHLSFDKAASNAAATANGFSNVGTTVVNEVQTLSFSTTPATGTYTVTAAGHTTAPIGTYTAAALASALNTALGSAGSVTVSGAGTSGSPFSVTFGGALSGTNVPTMTADTATGNLEDTTPLPVTATIGTTTTGSTTPGGTSSTLGSLSNSDYVYVTGDVPGAYTFRVFQDTNTNGAYDSPDERSSAVVTMNVFDVGGTGTTTDTSDDVYPVVAATSPSASGDPLPAEITYNKSLSLSDARGTSTSDGLPSQLAGLTWIDVNSTAAGVSSSTDHHPTYSSTTSKFTYAVGTPSGAGTVTLKTDLAAASPGGSYPTSGSKAVTVTATDVATVTSGATAVDGSVKVTGGAVAVKAGTATVEYTATALGSGFGTPPVPNAKVTFTVTGTAVNIAKLSADGTAGATTTTTKTYTATTDSKGVAKLKVTTSDPSAALTYTVDETSNGHTAPQTLTATYSAAAATTIETTSTSAELTPTVGTKTVAIKGAVKDQFGGAFVPGSSDSTQVTVEIPDGTQIGFAPLTSTGTFTYTYTAPTTPAPAVGDTTSFDYEYGSITDSNSQGGTIRWASAAAVSKITLTTPAAGAKSVGLLGNAAPVPAQGNTGTPPFGNTTGAVTGTAYDVNNAVLAYKAVTLSGDDGVWFSKTATPGASDKLVKTMDVVTDASGVISGAYVYFTKAGDHKVTATAGTVSSAATVTVDQADNNSGWVATVNDVSGAPGSTLIVTGMVKDIFGNPVPGADVDLSIDPATVGALGDSSIQTNAAGVFSTTFVTGTNSSGDVKLTAEISNNPTTLTPNATLVAAGFAAPDAVDMATGKIAVAATKLTLSSTAKVVAGGSGGTAKLSGKYLPDTSVDIWSKEAGEKSYSLMDSVMTDADGLWGLATKVDRSTYFLAKANGLSSPSDVTEVWSAVSLTAKSMGKGKVQLSANGDPNVKAPLNFYRSIGGKDPLLKKVTSSSSGVAKVTVSLPKGVRSVYVTYKAPGTTMGQSKTVKVTVK